MTAVLLAPAAALGTTAAYGTSTVLQSIGAGRAEAAKGLDPGLLLRLVRQGPYLAGLALDLVGVVLTVVALRRLPLFAVQAAIAASLAVTAWMSARFIHTPLSRREWSAIAAVGVGLVLVAASARSDAPPAASTQVRVALFAVVAAVVLGAIVAGGVKGSRGAALLGAAAGSAFGLGNAALRIIPDLHPLSLVTNVATYAAVLGGMAGLVIFGTALQRGAATIACATMIAAETVLPAVCDVAVFGERPRPGLVPVAIAGFACTVGGALSLARFAESTT